MFSMLGWNHVFLARSEEKEVLAEFEEVYPGYTAGTPGFTPCFG